MLLPEVSESLDEGYSTACARWKYEVFGTTPKLAIRIIRMNGSSIVELGGDFVSAVIGLFLARLLATQPG